MTKVFEASDVIEVATKPNESRRNLNTILLAIVIAVLCAMGSLTMNNTIKLAELGSKALTRNEVEAAVDKIRMDLMTMSQDMQRIKMDILTLQLQKQGGK